MVCSMLSFVFAKVWAYCLCTNYFSVMLVRFQYSIYLLLNIGPPMFPGFIKTRSKYTKVAEEEEASFHASVYIYIFMVIIRVAYDFHSFFQKFSFSICHFVWFLEAIGVK